MQFDPITGNLLGAALGLSGAYALCRLVLFPCLDRLFALPYFRRRGW